MGGVGSKRSLSITAGKYRITRNIRRLCAQRRRHEDFVQQSRPIRFFNITKTSAEASVAVNKEVIIRAYLVPDGGTAAIQLIEFQAEPEVDYTLEFKDLKPGTLYRLKIYYVLDTYKKVLSSTGTFLRREGRKILQSFKSDKVDGRRQTSGATRKRWTTAADSESSNVLIRRATGRRALESTTGRHEELPEVTLPREGFPGEKPVGIPVNYPKKLEVRTLPADWKGKESTQPRTMTRTFTSGIMPV